jgi:membrane protein involved in colicin uptake
MEINEQLIIDLPPKDPEISKRAASSLKIAENYEITNHQMYEFAADDLKSIKSLMKRVEEQRTSQVSPLNTEVKRINAEYKEPMNWLESAEQILKGKILHYTQAQERIAAEAQRKADEAARQERARIEAEQRAQQAEAQRQAQEAAQAEAAKRKAEADAAEAKRQADEAVANGNKEAAQAAFAAIEKADRERAEAEATESKARQAQEVAQAEAEASEMTALVTTATPVQVSSKVSGISTSKSWKARVTNKQALIQHIAAHPELLDWVEIKMTGLNGMAKALKQNMQIPGVEAYPDVSVSARAA